MLTRQSANSNKLETMAEEAQSGDGTVSSGINISLDNIIVTIHKFHTALNNDTKRRIILGFMLKRLLTMNVSCRGIL